MNTSLPAGVVSRSASLSSFPTVTAGHKVFHDRLGGKVILLAIQPCENWFVDWFGLD